MSNTTFLGFPATRTPPPTWSCLSTVFLCIYTSSYPDLAKTPHSIWRKLSEYTKIFLFNLSLKEVVCVQAFQQWRQARKLVKMSRGAQSTRDISMKQAFYLLSGGVEFVRDGEPSISSASIIDWLFNECSADSKARESVLKMLTEQLPEEAQLDRPSKTNVFTKTLASGQILWFSIQLATKLLTKLDVSLLEVDTTAFVVLTLASYTFSMERPSNDPNKMLVEVTKDTLRAELLAAVTGRETFEISLTELSDGKWGDEMMDGFWAMLALMLLNAAIHSAAWSHTFLDAHNQVLYRLICLIMFWPSALLLACLSFPYVGTLPGGPLSLAAVITLGTGTITFAKLAVLNLAF